ncbi:hypothetical protein EDD22DRAFT_788482, partial [Suillus occidentalis]
IGIPKAALAMIRLIFDGEDRRPRLFIVPICNKHDIFEGVESLDLILDIIPGLDFSITPFNYFHSSLVWPNICDHSPPGLPLEVW